MIGLFNYLHSQKLNSFEIKFKFNTAIIIRCIMIFINVRTALNKNSFIRKDDKLKEKKVNVF